MPNLNMQRTFNSRSGQRETAIYTRKYPGLAACLAGFWFPRELSREFPVIHRLLTGCGITSTGQYVPKAEVHGLPKPLKPATRIR